MKKTLTILLILVFSLGIANAGSTIDSNNKVTQQKQLKTDLNDLETEYDLRQREGENADYLLAEINRLRSELDLPERGSGTLDDAGESCSNPIIIPSLSSGQRRHYQGFTDNSSSCFDCDRVYKYTVAIAGRHVIDRCDDYTQIPFVVRESNSCCSGGTLHYPSDYPNMCDGTETESAIILDLDVGDVIWIHFALRYGYCGESVMFMFNITGASIPTGRCCYGDVAAPSCATKTEAQCDALGGEWFLNESCASNPCTMECIYDIEPDNNTCTGGPELFCGDSTCGWISNGGTDWYKIVLHESVPEITIDVYGSDTPGTQAYNGGLNPWVGLYAGSCDNQIDFNSDVNYNAPSGPVWNDCRIEHGALAAGTYYIKITSIDSYMERGTYVVAIDCDCAPHSRCCYGPPWSPVCILESEDVCEQVGGTWTMRADCSEPCPATVPCDGTLYDSGDISLAIPDDDYVSNCSLSGGITNSIVIPPTSEPLVVTDVNVGVDISHPFYSDLGISIEHNGVLVYLRAKSGISYSCDDIITMFDDEGVPWVENHCPYTDNNYQPSTSGDCLNMLSAFDGMPVEGTWTLRVVDGYSSDIGTLNSWALCIQDEIGCEAPDLVTIDVTDVFPVCQCVAACAGEPVTLCFAPLREDQLPASVRFTAGCASTEGGCNNGDCTPVIPETQGEYYYSSERGGWCVDVSAESDGCFCVCLDRILPVELTSFDAVTGDRSVTLNWSTASEKDNDRFDILRNETLVGRVTASNAATGYTYSWTEHNLINGHEYSYTLVAVDLSGQSEEIGTVSATPSFNAATITEYALHQNYPNPFNPSTTITFDLVEAGQTRIFIYNTLGQTLATLVNGELTAGRHTVNFDAAALPSGLYFYRMDAGDFSAVKKMILMK